MDDLKQTRDELLSFVRAPERKRREPSNLALYLAIIFANLVFGVIDAISGFTVYWMTEFILYGVLTFLAGVVPLLLHEFLFVRAYASELQKKIAVVGACVALSSVVVVGILAGVVNMRGVDTIGAQNAEISIVVSLVLIAALHAVLATIYFYVDNGIVAAQRTAQAIALAKHQSAQMKAAESILDIASESVEKRKALERKYVKHGPTQALHEVLTTLGIADENGDGIPDAFQKPQQAQPMRQYASETRTVPDGHPNPNGRHENQL